MHEKLCGPGWKVGGVCSGGASHETKWGSFSLLLHSFLLPPFSSKMVCVWGGWQYDLRVALPLIATAAFPIMPGFDRIAIWSYQKIV